MWNPHFLTKYHFFLSFPDLSINHGRLSSNHRRYLPVLSFLCTEICIKSPEFEYPGIPFETQRAV